MIVFYQDRLLRADRVTINTESGMGEAFGNIYLKTAEGSKIRSDRTLFNIKSEQGQIFQARGSINEEYLFKAEKMTRYSDTHYSMENGAITTCRGKIPDWLIETESMDIIQGDRILFRNLKLKVKDIPILYFPIGYIPMDRTRKSGLLIPSFGSSNTDGFTLQNAYYWAISQSTDATVYIDYLSKRGVKPGIEYRYAPADTVRGEFRGFYLDDDNDSKFWKVDMTHVQSFSNGFNFNGKLDLESDDGFNKTFENDTDQRTRRQTDSFASLNKTWTNNTLDILTRYRDSSQSQRDDTLGQLPQVTFKTQRIQLGKTGMFFNQESSFTSFLADLDTRETVDDHFTVQRLDFHPQISLPMNPLSWLTFTPTLGIRETVYSKGRDASGKKFSAFSRESFDFRGVLEGPKFHKIYEPAGGSSKFKHVIEPRFVVDYIPSTDFDDRQKIHTFDQVDEVDPKSLVTYSITQRLLTKDTGSENVDQSREALRFTVSQSYDLREDERAPSTTPNQPFSDLRVDLDSRLYDSLLLNFDAEYDVHDSHLSSLNLEVGVQATDSLTMLLERRYTKNENTFWSGTIDWAFKKGWKVQYSSRYDEQASTFRENDLSLLYDDDCECWGFTFDFIQRTLATGASERDETKFMLGIKLKGFGSISSGRDQRLIHRTLDDY